MSSTFKRSCAFNVKIGMLDMYTLLTFILLVGIFGGSSRYDAVQLLVLRPLCAFFLVYGLYRLRWRDIRGFQLPWTILVLVTILIGSQLIPLPPEIWMNLPGREIVSSLSLEIQQAEIWRPLSMAPSKTSNALAGMIVPICVLLLLTINHNLNVRLMLWVIVCFGVVNAFIGILQISASSDMLYFYQITNQGSPVGLFANTNHSATFSAIVLASISYLMMENDLTDSDVPGQNVDVYKLILGCAFLMVFLVIIVNRSRSGLLAASIVIVYLSSILTVRALAFRKNRTNVKKRNSINSFFSVGFGLVGVAMIATLLFSGQSEVVSRLLEDDNVRELRADVFPTLIEMIRTYFPFGSGFGSFENVYYIHEKVEYLRPSYLNQAHNDLLQVVIEGGIASVLILATGLLWVIRLIVFIYRQKNGLSATLFWISISLIMGLASATDYPLRTPTMQMFAVCLIWILICQARQKGDEAPRKGFAN